MIKRDTRPEMSGIWTDQNKFQKMLDVEIAACRAFAKQGIVPEKAVKGTAPRATISS